MTPVLRIAIAIVALQSLIACERGGDQLGAFDDALLADAPFGDAAAPPMLGTLERHRVDLSSPQPEQLQRVDVREGQVVRTGHVLAQLDTRGADAQLQAARSRIAAANALLAELVHGPRVESVLEARARLATADARLVREETELRRLRDLLARKLISRSLHDDRRLSRDAAREGRKEAQAQLQLLLAGTRIEQVDRARADWLAAQAELQRAQVTHDQLTLIAPATARVEALPYRPGERPPVGAPIVQLILDGVPFARVYVPAEQRALMVPGALVAVSVDGQAAVMTGTVRFIASEASFTPYFALTQRDRGHLVYLAEIDVPDASRLATGLPVEVRVARTHTASAPGAR